MVRINLSDSEQRILNKKTLEIKHFRSNFRIKNAQEKLIVSSVAIGLAKTYSISPDVFIFSNALASKTIEVVSSENSDAAKAIVDKLKQRRAAALRVRASLLRRQGDDDMKDRNIVEVELRTPEETQKTMANFVPYEPREEQGGDKKKNSPGSKLKARIYIEKKKKELGLT